MGTGRARRDRWAQVELARAGAPADRGAGSCESCVCWRAISAAFCSVCDHSTVVGSRQRRQRQQTNAVLFVAFFHTKTQLDSTNDSN